MQFHPDPNHGFWAERLTRLKHGEAVLQPQHAHGNAAFQRLRQPAPKGVDFTPFKGGLARRPAFLAPCVAALRWLLNLYRDGQESVILVELPEGGPLFLSGGIETDTSGADLLRRVEEELAQVWMYRHYDADRVKRELGIDPAWDLGRLFPIAIALHSLQSETWEPGSREVSLEIANEEHRDQITIHYDGGRFERDFIRQLGSHWSRALELLLQEPDQPLRHTALLSERELERLLLQFNGTARDFGPEQTLHHWIGRQARQTPHAPAVIHARDTLSYAELQSLAKRLAAHLHGAFGVRRGDRVGLMCRRSHHMIAAMFGILEAGAAYVPLDAKHPWEVIDHMIADAGIRVLLTDADSLAQAETFEGEVLVLDFELEDLAENSAFEGPAAPADPAYVIFTSGSTGRPKGVVIEHRAVVNTLLWRNEFYGIQEGEVHLQIPSYAFDSSVVDIFSALLTGGTLVIPDEDARLDPRYLKGLMLEFGVHRFIMTPSFYKLVVKELTGSELKLRSVTLAGEAATLDLADEHYRHLPRVALYNEYGPTENAVCSTACLLASDATRISIGSPISNCGVAILDEGMRPLPVGVPGEIYLAGAGLARGYFNRPELTAARFLPNPLPQWPESRLYRTGDRGCWRPGGDLEFLGRVDHQVKIRGFRIELDEIEMALLRHEAVENAAALCKHDASGNPYLSAYVTLSGRLAKTSLRAYLQETLPYYMLPEFLHLLDNMPLTVNGKIDRAALEEYRDLDENASSEPSTESELERRLREIWLKVFKRDRIGIHDNFFEIGGNSLKVIEMISLIRAEMDRELAVLDLYNYPTVKRLALKIGEPVEASETHGDSA